MKKSILIIVLMAPLIVTSQVTLDWLQYTAGVSIAVDPSDNVFTVNYVYALGGDITLTKRDRDGNMLWQATYNQTSTTRWDKATWVACDHEGNAIVTGTVMSGYSNPVNANSIVMKFDAAGNMLWRNVYETDFDGSYTIKCLVDASNNIYVLGTGTGPSGFVTKVKKFDPDGNPIWSYFDNAGIGAPINFKFTPDESILIIGRGIFGSINGYSRIDKDGNNIWNYAGILSLTAGDAAGDEQGNTYLVHGEYVSNGGSVVKKISPSGTLLWEQTYDVTAFRIEVGNDNNAVFCGFPDQGTPGASFIKINSAGVIIWENMDADGPLALLLHARLLLDEFNNAYLAAGTLFEMAVCKVNSDGSSAWTAKCTGGYSNNIALASDLSVFVVGGTTAHFVEDPVCKTPINISTSDISATTAKLSWQTDPTAVYYEIWYKKSSDAKWRIKLLPPAKSHWVIKKLKCNTNYEWKIRSVCDTIGNDLSSEFSGLQVFSTAACRLENFTESEALPLVYPNPATNLIRIALPGYAGKITVQVVDMSNRVVSGQTEEGSEELVIDVRGLANGVYLLYISDDEGIASVVKWIKE